MLTAYGRPKDTAQVSGLKNKTHAILQDMIFRLDNI